MSVRRRTPVPFSRPLPTARSRRLLQRGAVPAATLTALVAASLSPVAITAAYAATANPAPNAGVRNGGTRLPFTVSGQTNLLVDVGTGNALLSDQLMTLPGINNDVPVTLAWNSSLAASGVPSAVTGQTGSGWSITGFDQRLILNADSSMTYYGPQDLTGVFALQSGSTTAYTTPGQFKDTLIKNADGTWKMTEHQSQNALVFNTSGRLISITDRNNNVTTFGYNGTNPAYILTTRGGPWGTSHQTAAVTMTGSQITAITEANGSSSRSVSFHYDSSARLSYVTDLAGVNTSITYGDNSAGSPSTEIKQITSPTGASTTLTYGTGNQVTQVDQANRPAGAAGTSTTRLTYPSTTQTLVADPATNQAQAVSAVPHTTYTVDSSTQLISSSTDPDGHAQSATYTSFGDASNSTTQATGSTAFNYPTTTNNGESLTGVTTAGGATNTAAYGNAGKAQYSPSSATTDSSNSLKYTYDGFGNQASTAQGTGPTANVTYTTQGQPSTSASPGAAAGVVTTYNYDNSTANSHIPTYNLTSITPVSSTNLGVRTYTYDDYARLKTATDGRGNTITYTYDTLDRITRVDYSDTTTDDIAYTYDNDGRVTQRLDVTTNKATTSTYDDLGHLLTTNNAAGTGGTETYTYDKAGYLASRADGSGTTTYGYDGAHLLTTLTYPQGSTTQTTRFGYDAAGRRTDVWLQANADHSSWAAHENTTYDSSGRVTAVLGQNGPATSASTVVNQTACYNTGAGTSTCSTTGSDRHQLQWIKNTITGETTSYTYDTNSRLQSAAVTGGSNPRDYLYSYDARGNRLTAAVTHDTLTAGGQLTTGQQLTSLDGSAKFVMQTDGNAVLYGPSGALFSTGTTGSGNKVVMQTDGNLVVYNSGGTSLWSSGTSGSGTANRLVMQGDHNLVMYTSANAVAWQSGTGGTQGPATGVGTTLTFNNANQIATTGYTYDGAGNQTANPTNTAAYNTAGQQTSTVTAGVTTTYTYAGTNNDELLSESTPNNHTYKYVYGRTDGNGLPEIDQVQYDATATAYVIHDNNGNPLMLQPNNAITSLYMNDVLGNPILLSSSAQTTSFSETYDPYGADTETNTSGGSAVNDNPYLFHYGTQDRITGNVKFGTRYYDPTTGAWTQQDTYNAPLDAGNANRYVYAAGDPVNVSDPSGKGFWDDYLAVGTTLLGIEGEAIDYAVDNPGQLAITTGANLSCAGGIVGAGASAGLSLGACLPAAVNDYRYINDEFDTD